MLCIVYYIYLSLINAFFLYLQHFPAGRCMYTTYINVYNVYVCMWAIFELHTHTHNWLVVWNILKIWKSVGKDYPFFSMENKIHVWNTTNQIMNKTTTASLMTTSSQFFNPKLGKYHSEFKIQSKKHSKLCLDPDPCIQHVFETARQLVASFPFVISFQR